MEQRFAVLAEGATPVIYKVTVNQTARITLTTSAPICDILVFEI